MQIEAMVTMETGQVARRSRDSERNRLRQIGKGEDVRSDLDRDLQAR